ncbi:Pleckstrin homology-like domain family B member 1 [Labeo rohita]|uniref:Pleckstrin homology-like domain family B member 1 n=1 Tax=Labeo rohita TaxID=84645 RepID=A0ABQ8MBU1_LABRO|nr:Pleckstrin homology-like domain family B member 1 [Labeo rohita]
MATRKVSETPLDLIDSGRGLKVWSATPYLISLGCGFITLIPLTKEISQVSFEDAESPQNVTADGPGIQPHHCVITNSAGVITLHPNGNMCHLDGVPVTKPTRLTHDFQRMFQCLIVDWSHPSSSSSSVFLNLSSSFSDSTLQDSFLSLFFLKVSN